MGLQLQVSTICNGQQRMCVVSVQILVSKVNRKVQRWVAGTIHAKTRLSAGTYARICHLLFKKDASFSHHGDGREVTQTKSNSSPWIAQRTSLRTWGPCSAQMVPFLSEPTHCNLSQERNLFCMPYSCLSTSMQVCAAEPSS